MPRLITCPDEMVALSAAHGPTSRRRCEAQAVIVHVECGTQALAGAVHNAAKGRAPVPIFAGISPITQEGELPRQCCRPLDGPALVCRIKSFAPRLCRSEAEGGAFKTSSGQAPAPRPHTSHEILYKTMRPCRADSSPENWFFRACSLARYSRDWLFTQWPRLWPPP